MNTMCQIGVNMVDIRGEKKVRWQRRRRHGHSVRPRGTALTLSVAMAIAVLDLLALDTDTMAFYSFRDGAAGTTAVGTPILNVADKTRYVGTASVKDATQAAPAPHNDKIYKGGVDFDDDAPAKYVFEGSLPGATVICTNPQSLHFTGDPERWSSYDKQRAGGNVSFADIGSALSTCDEYTLEFFWKVDADAFYRADDGDVLTYNCGYLYNDEPAATRLTLPENAYMARVWFGNMNVKQLSLNYQYSPTFWPTDGSVTFVGDGKWHHFVLRQIKGGDGSLGYASYFDYDLPDHNTRNKPKEPVVIARGTVSGSEPLDLGRYFYRGKIACLRIVKRNLAANELLRAPTTSITGRISATRFSIGGLTVRPAHPFRRSRTPFRTSGRSTRTSSTPRRPPSCPTNIPVRASPFPTRMPRPSTRTRCRIPGKRWSMQVRGGRTSGSSGRTSVPSIIRRRLCTTVTDG